MPPTGDKHFTLAYAAGASLAAVTLVYVFGPTWLIDSSNTSPNQRKKGVVGLVNTANDCFINSILQALAGLGELRVYLVRRTRSAKENGELLGEGLTVEHRPFLTGALKDILDSLNERPIYRKTISARPFLTVLERVFRQRISRAQQDAHEFLQVVVETLAEEYHQQRRGEREAQRLAAEYARATESIDEDEDDDACVVVRRGAEGSEDWITEQEEDKVTAGSVEDQDGGMPMEGKLESEIECMKCRFKPKPTVSTFVVLTLPVPLKNSTSLSDCIDGVLSTEYIDDFQCAKCRLQHAISILDRRLASASGPARDQLQTAVIKLEEALEKDPEAIPEGIILPPTKDAPKSRIARRTRMSHYPKIITFHLSRSIYDIRSSSRKNGAKVSFEENLQLGGLIDRKRYKLLCVVTHKGGHESGHYECFRRQITLPAPFSTPTPSPSAPTTPIPSTPASLSTIRLVPQEPVFPMVPGDATADFPPASAPPSTRTSISSLKSETKSTTPPSSVSPHQSSPERIQTPTPEEEKPEPHHHHHRSNHNNHRHPKQKHKGKVKKRHTNDRWWRISDEKVKEARTSDVVGMQKEVYLLFYERVRDDE